MGASNGGIFRSGTGRTVPRGRHASDSAGDSQWHISQRRKRNGRGFVGSANNLECQAFLIEGIVQAFDTIWRLDAKYDQDMILRSPQITSLMLEALRNET